MKKIHDNAVKYRLGVDVKYVMEGNIWFVPHHTLNIEQGIIITEHALSEVPTNIAYIQWSVQMKAVEKQNCWTLEIGLGDKVVVPVFIIVGFQQEDRSNDQTLNTDASYMPPVWGAQYIIRTEKTFNAGKTIVHADDVYPQGFDQKKLLG